jgi:hypothetical protein
MRGNAPRESGGFRLSVVLGVDLYYPGGGSVLLRRLLLGLENDRGNPRVKKAVPVPLTRQTPTPAKGRGFEGVRVGVQRGYRG